QIGEVMRGADGASHHLTQCQCARYVYRSSPKIYVRTLEFSWASPRIVPATRDAFARTVSASACRRGGDAKYSVGVGGRDESASRFSCRVSTPAPDSSSNASRRLTRRYRLTRGAELQALARDGKR